MSVLSNNAINNSTPDTTPFDETKSSNVPYEWIFVAISVTFFCSIALLSRIYEKYFHSRDTYPDGAANSLLGQMSTDNPPPYKSLLLTAEAEALPPLYTDVVIRGNLLHPADEV